MGNGIYYVENGVIFYADFDKITGDYLGLYKLDTPVGVQIPSNDNSGANGYLTKNPDPLSKSLYYAGYNGSIYQIVKREDFDISKEFEILKSTPSGFFDLASNGLVYHRNHVFYRSSSSLSQLYNLFYIDIPGVANCKPKYLREGVEFKEVVEAELMDADNGELRGMVFPNPAENQVTINVYGKENEIGSLEIYDMQGQLIQREAYYFEPQSVDLSEFTAGIYVVKVTSPSTSKPISFKVIKK